MVMNTKGQNATLGFALLLVAFILIITSFVTIEPLKESLDTVRDGTALNCPGTLNFNETSYSEQNSLEKLTRRPTCFATGISMDYFVGAFMIAVIVWLVRNWRKVS